MEDVFTCMCVYIYAVANNVMIVIFIIRFYNIILKIKHKLHTASGSGPPSSPPPQPVKNSGRTAGKCNLPLKCLGQQTNSTPENREMPQGSNMAKLRKVRSRSWQDCAAVTFQRSNCQHLVWLWMWSKRQFSGTNSASLWKGPSETIPDRAYIYHQVLYTVVLWFTTTCSLVVNGTNVSQQHSATTLYPEGGSRTFLRQVVADVPNYTTSSRGVLWKNTQFMTKKPRRSGPTTSPPSKSTWSFHSKRPTQTPRMLQPTCGPPKAFCAHWICLHCVIMNHCSGLETMVHEGGGGGGFHK